MLLSTHWCLVTSLDLFLWYYIQFESAPRLLVLQVFPNTMFQESNLHNLTQREPALHQLGQLWGINISQVLEHNKHKDVCLSREDTPDLLYHIQNVIRKARWVLSSVEYRNKKPGIKEKLYLPMTRRTYKEEKREKRLPGESLEAGCLLKGGRKRYQRILEASWEFKLPWPLPD